VAGVSAAGDASGVVDASYASVVLVALGAVDVSAVAVASAGSFSTDRMGIEPDRNPLRELEMGRVRGFSREEGDKPQYI
jgi:hypothetical protein